MQEQPPSEPIRREPAERARRRSPRATFTPPTAAEQPAETAVPPPAAPASQRPRRAKPAPAVLFQPPDPDRPLPRQPRRAPTSDAGAEQPQPPTGEANGDRPAPPSVDASTSQPDPANAKQADPANAEQPRPATPEQPRPQAATADAGPPRQAAPVEPKARTTSVRKAAPKKAAEATVEVTPTTPAPRKRVASPAKRTASPRKSTTPRKAVPEPAAEQHTPLASPVEQQIEPASARTPESELRAVAARVLDHPGFAPELLALAAVRALGPGAADWAGRLRARYPDAPADGLARLATRRFVRSAGAGGATAALAGFFAPLAELTSVLWTHANLVLHLAAAYGRDPAHPDRAVELLVLTQVHPDAASAEAALAAAQAAGDPVEGAWPRAAEAAWRLAAPLTAQAGGWVALRLVARLLPGAAVLAAALGDAAAADRLASRAVAVYRPDRR
ncbi:hypothetical protein [Micromonospora zamorensis]|uniref:hypothetical protein n=1 Tax=Micromonospora zamorensis TaxID=709883 RepID=UPI001E4B3943|nr:hypothetical protein [Micromonospora zamorensis]WSK51806.1 hypothetical protein OG423_16340 [Micromonospora zamorensis]